MKDKEKLESVKTVSVELTAEQYAFLTGWQKTHEDELGIEVPIQALVRKAVDGAMKAAQRPPRADKPGFGARNAGPRRDGPSDRSPRTFGGKFGDKPERRSFGDKPSFGASRGGPRPGGRPAGRPPMGRGPKFDMLSKGKSRRFDDK
jgi:hypothetical protein